MSDASLYSHILRFHLPSVGSTNAEATQRLREGTPPPFWITAAEQRAGRGRGGHGWISPPGNLYASIAWATERPVAEVATLAFVASLAVHDLLAALIDEADAAVPLSLKWPNDVLCDGAKISGILLESTTIGGIGLCAVIGCGINCATAPDISKRRVTSLRALGLNDDLDIVFDRLDTAMRHWLTLWATSGFAGVRGPWLQKATGLGEPITVRLSGETFDAVFDGIAPDGALIARLDSGARRMVSAGDVFFAAHEATAV